MKKTIKRDLITAALVILTWLITLPIAYYEYMLTDRCFSVLLLPLIAAYWIERYLQETLHL